MQDFTNYNPDPRSGSVDRASVSSEALFFQHIYTWMFAGLAVTAVVAYVLSGSEAFIRIMYSSPWIRIGSFVGLMGLVFYLSARIESMTPASARFVFMVFAALMGASLAGVALVYSPSVIFKTFVTTAGVYGALALYGLVTKRSLQAWGSFLFIGLIGIILASLVSVFIPGRSPGLDLGIGIVGVIVFAGLTAYDHQRLRALHAIGLDGTADGESRQVIMGALTLYLNFINLFLMLLRIFGGRSN